MKKFQKFLSALLALSMALAVPAFAAGAPDDPAMDGAGLVEAGQFEDGTHYWVLQLSDAASGAVAAAIAGADGAGGEFPGGAAYAWAGNVSVPVADGSGGNGQVVGYPFAVCPDRYVVFGIEGSLPSVMPTIQVSYRDKTGGSSNWRAGLSANQVVVFELGQLSPESEIELRVSTAETQARTADVWFYTSPTCPARDFTGEI